MNKLRNNPEKTVFHSSEIEKKLQQMDARAWTLATLLIIPGFYLYYYLKSDLQKHEKHEQEFLTEVIFHAKNSGVTLDIQSYRTTPYFPKKKYIVFSIVTLGFAAAYWLYRIFNDYNYHFKMQWIIEDELFRFLKDLEQKAS